MRKHGCDALGITTGDWFEWAANHILGEQSWERPSLLVVTASGRAIAFISEQSRFGVLAELEAGDIWVDEVTFFSEWPGSNRKWLLQQWPEMVADVLTAEGLDRAKMLVDASSPALDAAARRLPGLRIVPAGADLHSLRYIKHAGEIAVMREALDLCDWGMRLYREELRPGRLVEELDFSISAQVSVEAARRFPGEHCAITRLGTKSGADAARIKGDRASTGRTIEPDKVAVSTLVIRLNSMTTELTRPFLMGRDPQMHRLFDAARAAQEASAEQAVAGRPIKAMHAAAQRVIQHVVDREGFDDWLEIRTNHPIGMTMHEFPSDTPINERPLIEHELFSIEPGIYLREVGAFRFADPFWIGKAGAEQISITTKERDWFTLAG